MRLKSISWVLVIGTWILAGEASAQDGSAKKAGGPAAGAFACPRGQADCPGAGEGFAGPNGHHAGGVHSRRATRLVDRLELDETTRKKLSAVIEKTSTQETALRSTLDAAVKALRDALAEDKPRRAKVMKLAQQLGAHRTKLLQLHLALRLDIEHALPEDKRAAWRTMVDQPPRMGRGRGPGRRAKGGPGGPGKGGRGTGPGRRPRGPGPAAGPPGP